MVDVKSSTEIAWRGGPERLVGMSNWWYSATGIMVWRLEVLGVAEEKASTSVLESIHNSSGSTERRSIVVMMFVRILSHALSLKSDSVPIPVYCNRYLQYTQKLEV